MSDAVNHPSHYTGGDIECIDAIKASMTNEAFLGYLKGNIQKYLWRYEKKVAPIEDLKKAKWYLERLIKEQADGQKLNACAKYGDNFETTALCVDSS